VIAALTGNKEVRLKYPILLTLLAFSFSSSACKEIKMAHNKLLKSHFSIKEGFSLYMDDENKVKLTRTIEYNNGSVIHSQKLISFIAEGFEFEESGIEPFMISDFRCKNIKVDGEKVTINFDHDDENYISHFLYQKEKLLPVKTVIEAEVGVLFMNWDIKIITDYSNFKALL
jgi:hypothetical protein|tara:strand:- start:916 stop:1431 length:516 start_codon:yes stop_codon:yes gene_type:complete